MKIYRTEDGYKFYVLPDGTVAADGGLDDGAATMMGALPPPWPSMVK